MFDIPLTKPKTPPKIPAFSLIDGKLVESDDGDLIRREDHRTMISYYKAWHNYEVTDRYNFMSGTLASEIETRVSLLDQIKSLKAQIRKLKLDHKREINKITPTNIETIMKELIAKLDGVSK